MKIFILIRVSSILSSCSGLGGTTVSLVDEEIACNLSKEHKTGTPLIKVTPVIYKISPDRLCAIVSYSLKPVEEYGPRSLGAVATDVKLIATNDKKYGKATVRAIKKWLFKRYDHNLEQEYFYLSIAQNGKNT